MSDPKIPTPAAGADGLGNNMSDRSGWTSESESGDTDTPVGQPDTSLSGDIGGTPTAQGGSNSGQHQTGTEYGADPQDDKPM